MRADLLEAPLKALFWSQPAADRLAEIEQRISAVINAAVPAEPVQLFDDLYLLEAC